MAGAPSPAGLPSRPALLAEALEQVRQIHSDWLRSRALRGLAACLLPEFEPNVLDLARGLDSPGARARALNDLAPRLTTPRPAQAAAEALSAAREIADPAARASVLSGIASLYAGAEQASVARLALEAALEISGPTDRAWLWPDCPRSLPAKLLPPCATSRPPGFRPKPWARWPASSTPANPGRSWPNPWPWRAALRIPASAR